MQISNAARRAYESDGVVCVRGALTSDELDVLDRFFELAISEPGPMARHFPQSGPGITFSDFSNVERWPLLEPVYRSSGLPDIVSALWSSPTVTFLQEQVWWKTGGGTDRTPWHQDSSYLSVFGAHAAVVWISLTPVAPEDSLEFVAGSHRGAIEPPPAWRPGAESGPAREGRVLSWGVERGDVAIFDLSTVHGGAATKDGQERRTVSLRYVGHDAWFRPRDDQVFGTQSAPPDGVGDNRFDEMLRSIGAGARVAGGPFPMVRGGERAPA